MKRDGTLKAAGLAAGWAAVRLAFPPPGHNTHTLMYPLVEYAGAYNTLEPFHPLYHPVVAVVRRLWELVGMTGPALPALQAVSLLAGMANIVLMHRVVKRASDREDAALAAAAIMACTANLWSWSLQTTSYTLSTACVLATVLAAMNDDSLRAGLWAGLAAGFDSASALAAVPALVMLKRRSWFLLGFAAPLIAGYALLVERLASMGWPFPPTVSGFFGSLPKDIVPLWKSLDVVRQLKAWWTSRAPADWPILTMPFLLAWSWKKEKKLWPFAAWLWLLVTAFFFVNDPDNRFKYLAALLAPALLAMTVPRKALAFVFVLLAAKAAFDPPDYVPELNAGLDEAAYLAARLGPKDRIIALSDPDWSVMYGLAGRVPVLEAPPSEKELDAVLCGGGKAVLAADALFRSSRHSPAELEKRAQALWKSLNARYSVEPAWVSPAGQHYQPLKAKRPCPI